MTTSKADFDYRSITTLEAACAATGTDPEKVFNQEDTPDEKAYKILKVAYKAVNNGWVPRPGDSSQYKYFPWFEVLPSGLGFSVSAYNFVYTCAGVGSRLCTDTSEKALHIAQYFEAEYKAFLLLSE